jgi:hypothetical protein
MGGAGTNWGYNRHLNGFPGGSWDNYGISVSGHGIWLLYENQDYNQNTLGGVEVFPMLGVNDCNNLVTLPNKVSSWKFAGYPHDYRMDTITIYEGKNFQGLEYYTAADDNPKVTLNMDQIGSLIVTGDYKVGWTLYEYGSYRGLSKCVFAPESSNFTPLLMADADRLPFLTVRSIRKGCFVKNLNGEKNGLRNYHNVEIVPTNI